MPDVLAWSEFRLLIKFSRQIFDVYQIKKETHHLELLNSQEDHKWQATLVNISAKVCQVLLPYMSFENLASKLC